jgi:hypothetical protein
MDHTQFKANQTAAGYVADGLDENTQEAFELHMMGCAECVDDVEVWRAIKLDMPRPSAAARTAIRPRMPALLGWRMAASLLGASVVGVAGGWFGNAMHSAGPDLTQTVVFNIPNSPTRGAEDCTALLLAADTRTVVLRLPGLPRDSRVVALDADKRELPSAQITGRLQPDGSRILRIDSQAVAGRSVHLETRSAGGLSEPLGCFTGETP